MPPPWTDVAFVGVYWNDPERVGNLLEHVRPWFSEMVVGVQSDDLRDDKTFEQARRWADLTISDHVHGHCEPTIGKVLGKVRAPWTFLVSADEFPSTNLLNAFGDMMEAAARDGNDGFWIRMLSTIEEIAYPSEQDNHLRVFQTHLRWPETIHSRPETKSEVFWRPEDILHHDRSLDEMMVDYIRYTFIGRSNPNWVAHNKLMMHDACEATAKHYGWDYVRKYEWWPQVREAAFDGVDPEIGATE